jgi:hypothetical protein
MAAPLDDPLPVPDLGLRSLSAAFGLLRDELRLQQMILDRIAAAQTGARRLFLEDEAAQFKTAADELAGQAADLSELRSGLSKTLAALQAHPVDWRPVDQSLNRLRQSADREVARWDEVIRRLESEILEEQVRQTAAAHETAAAGNRNAVEPLSSGAFDTAYPLAGRWISTEESSGSPRRFLLLTVDQAGRYKGDAGVYPPNPHLSVMCVAELVESRQLSSNRIELTVTRWQVATPSVNVRRQGAATITVELEPGSAQSLQIRQASSPCDLRVERMIRDQDALPRFELTPQDLLSLGEFFRRPAATASTEASPVPPQTAPPSQATPAPQATPAQPSHPGDATPCELAGHWELHTDAPAASYILDLRVDGQVLSGTYSAQTKVAANSWGEKRTTEFTGQCTGTRAYLTAPSSERWELTVSSGVLLIEMQASVNSAAPVPFPGGLKKTPVP